MIVISSNGFLTYIVYFGVRVLYSDIVVYVSSYAREAAIFTEEHPQFFYCTNFVSVLVIIFQFLNFFYKFTTALVVFHF